MSSTWRDIALSPLCRHRGGWIVDRETATGRNMITCIDLSQLPHLHSAHDGWAPAFQYSTHQVTAVSIQSNPSEFHRYYSARCLKIVLAHTHTHTNDGHLAVGKMAVLTAVVFFFLLLL